MSGIVGDRMPEAGMATFNAHLNAYFLKNGSLLTVRPRFWVIQEGLAVVPVNVPIEPMPVAIVTLKNRTLSPTVERFAECAREVGKSIGGRSVGSQRKLR
ncbi:MAG TPA: hypothetical protein VFC54_09075 [Pseudolabrys sp.]|nr:hypothetical protein [Pseudolabrys sp.]